MPSNIHLPSPERLLQSSSIHTSGFTRIKYSIAYCSSLIEFKYFACVIGPDARAIELCSFT